MKKLRPGKLPAQMLADLFGRHMARPAGVDRVVIPPRVGEDAAVLELPDRFLVVAADPVTFVTEDLGHYLVTVNANDVATLGARPLFFTAVLLFPVGTRRPDVNRVFSDIAKACAAQGVAWVGGHTEVTPTVSAPLAVGQMIGEVDRDRLVRKQSLRPGDRLLLTKELAVEAVSIIARTRTDEVQLAHGEAFLERAWGFVHDPGIGVVQEALAAAAVGGVHGMHDPTEGGLAGGLHELSAAAELGIVVRRDAIPVSAEARALCEQFGLDPLGVIASGSLLVAVEPQRAAAVQAAVQALGTACAEIGEVTATPGCRFDDGAPLPTFEADEITRLLEG